MKALLRISSDIMTKAAKTRARFTRRLAANLRAALEGEGISGSVTRDHVRLYLESDDERAFEAARRIFGVHSVSPCLEEPFTSFDALIARGVDIFAERVRGRSYAVRAKVRGEHAFGSQQVNETLGGALMPFGAVKLTRPEVTVQIELRGGVARFYTERLPAVPGLPLGVEGRGVLLLSGGFDSAVAAWLAMRRGVSLDYVFCRLGGPAHERAVLPIANHLQSQWSAGASSRLFVVPFEAVAEMLGARVSERMRQLVLKQLMYRVAASIARFVHAEAIFTGESLGQVSSQTLKNLRALEAPENVPIHRPLLTHTKEEIIALAREIGTHDLSVSVPEYCALVPRHPATGASRRETRDATALMSFDPWEAAHLAERLDLPAPVPMAGFREEVDEIPDGALVLDIRPPELYEAWHPSGARLVEAASLSADPLGIPRDQSCVIVCQFGLRSSWVARNLRRQGFDALSLRGGASRFAPQQKPSD